jgi:GNAT superfamily N-acetyltransferase
MPSKPRARDLVIQPLSAARVEDVRTVLSGTFGSQCWDLFFRFTNAQRGPAGIDGKTPAQLARRKEILAKLARRRNGAGLMAYVDGEPVGFMSLGPRSDYPAIVESKTMPAVDDVPVWIIPCITVRRGYRGQGIAIAMICAAVAHAAERGAPAVEGYARAGKERVHDGSAHMGTESMYRRAGFKRVRGVMKDLPRGWTPRVTMRASSAASAASRTSKAR